MISPGSYRDDFDVINWEEGGGEHIKHQFLCCAKSQFFLKEIAFKLG